MNCPRCSTAVDGAAKYCPQCGWNLQKPWHAFRWSPGNAVKIVLVAALLWGTSNYIQISKAGIKPTKPFEQNQSAGHAAMLSDPEIVKFREAVEADPDNIEVHKAYALLLLDKIRHAGEKPPQGLVLEATDALGVLLRLQPKDPDTLVALADLSFNQKVFDKSAQLYQRYLAERPDDLATRARYASSLAFVGRPQEAIAELESVLSKDPRNFHALAYMSIAYAQVGNNARAQEVGKRALEFSPSPEARERFQEFLTALAADEKGAGAPSRPAQGQGGVAELAAAVAANPIAGPKYVRYETPSPSELVVVLRDFPMQAMPPFAKEKFFSGIREKAQSLGLRELKVVTFKDAESMQTLDSLVIEPVS